MVFIMHSLRVAGEPTAESHGGNDADRSEEGRKRAKTVDSVIVTYREIHVETAPPVTEGPAP
jgi:hypothetical protein